MEFVKISLARIGVFAARLFTFYALLRCSRRAVAGLSSNGGN